MNIVFISLFNLLLTGVALADDRYIEIQNYMNISFEQKFEETTDLSIQRKIIHSSALRQGWKFYKLEESLYIDYRIRDHYLKYEIQLSANSFSLIYKESDNLTMVLKDLRDEFCKRKQDMQVNRQCKDYQPFHQKIHRNAHLWVEKLIQEIQAQAIVNEFSRAQ